MQDISHYTKRILAIGLIAIFVIAFVSLFNKSTATAADARIVTVHIDGQTKTLATNAKTVAGVIKRLKVDLGSEDKTEPSLKEVVKGSAFTINVYRARPITIVDGPNNYTVVTAERAPAAIAKEAGFKVENEDELIYRRSDNSFNGTPGTQMIIMRSKNIEFSLYGKKSELNTRSETVQELLEELNIELEEKDEVNLPLNTRLLNNMSVSIDNVERDFVTKEEVVKFEEELIHDAQQPVSYRKVKEPGVNGRKLVTYEIVIKNGAKPERIVKKEVIIKKPIKQITVVGAKSWSGSREQWLLALRMCESGGNYQINTGNGFYGAYQFMASTWTRIAQMVGRPDLANILPHQAQPVDQDYMIIRNTQLSSGGLASQNPGCYKSTGISQFPPD